MAADYGAHEVMELQEVLTDVVDNINQFELYRPYVTDQELSMLLDRQVSFMTQEYNETVQALKQRGMSNTRTYQAAMNNEPQYGLDNPNTQSPNTSAKRMDNRDVASGMLGSLKSSSILKSMACLECADLSLRRMVQQGALNCSEMAYEVWQYMNQKGYYQVPTMKQMTTETMLNTYVPANTNNMANMNNMNASQTVNYDMVSNTGYNQGPFANYADNTNFANNGNLGNTMSFANGNQPGGASFPANSNIPQGMNSGAFTLQ